MKCELNTVQECNVSDLVLQAKLARSPDEYCRIENRALSLFQPMIHAIASDKRRGERLFSTETKVSALNFTFLQTWRRRTAFPDIHTSLTEAIAEALSGLDPALYDARFVP